MGVMDGAVNGMVMRLCGISFSPDEAFCIAQAAYIAPNERDPSVLPSILNRQEVTWEVDLALKRLGPHPMGPEAHRQRILLWEKIFGFGTWHEPIDLATIYLHGDPKPPLPPSPTRVIPRPPHAQGAAPSSVQPASGTGDLSGPLYGATFAQAYSRFWRKYATASGRASLSEYWWAALANLLIVFVLGLAGTSSGRGGGYFFGILYLVFLVAVIIPCITITVRRLHDANLSGWYYLLTLIPVVGAVILAQPSDPRGGRFDNQAAGVGVPQPRPRDIPDPMPPQSDRSPRSAVSFPSVAATSQNEAPGLDHQVVARASDGSPAGAVAIIVIALVVIGVFLVAGTTQKPQSAVSGSAANDGQAAAIRSALQGAPDWHHYTDDVYFRWDPNPQCVGTLPCNGVDVETASTQSCSFGSVWLDLMRNGVVVDSRIGDFQSLSAGIPKLVQVYWNPNITVDHVQINHIACGS